MSYDKTKTKVYKKKKCQEILKKGSISEEEKIFLTELIKNHENYDSKVGCGILDFFIKRTQWNNNGFYIKRIDGTETDFSYIACLLPKSKLQNIKIACRSAIAEDMMRLSHKGSIAHHDKIPFIEIFNRWIKNWDIEKLEINETKDNCVTTYFRDNEVAEDFKKFHNSIANIKIITPKEHNEIHFGETK